MSRWTDSLPKAQGNERRIWLHHALSNLNWALLHEGHNDHLALRTVRRAAAETRAWRKSLPEQFGRIPSEQVENSDDRTLLRMAIRNLMDADACGRDAERVIFLRWAEAHLRVFGLRLMDRSE